MVDIQVNFVFYNQGLRSYIEVDLCRQCPRQDDKGCCGFYSPVFYPTDLVYLEQHRPELVEEIFCMEGITVLDYSVTVNQKPDGDSYRCRFHSSQGGCRLNQQLRESVCRHFVCPDIGWEKEPGLQRWKLFFEQLADLEISINNRIGEAMAARDLSLRRPSDRPRALALMKQLVAEETRALPAFITELPAQESVIVSCELRYGREWTL